jgi:hypothetical protein
MRLILIVFGIAAALIVIWAILFAMSMREKK